MSFQEVRGGYRVKGGEPSEFQASLLALAASRDASRAEAAREKRAFEEKWEKVRDTAITPVFRETVACLHSSVLHITTSNLNGLGAVLQNNQNSLSFIADQTQDQITCSGVGLDEEKFDFDKLDRGRVEAIVKKFVKFCLDQSSS
jgi:hypothetical protein